MAHVLFHLLPVLWLLNAIQTFSDCSMKRTSSLRFSVKSTVNELGQRIVSVESLGEAREPNKVEVSVEHWTAICNDLQVVGLQLNVTDPNSNIDTPTVTSIPIPHITTVKENFTTDVAVPTMTEINATSSIPTDPQNITTGQPIFTPLSALSCRSGYRTLPGDGCYILIKEKLTWNGARQNCKRHGDKLAVPETEQQLDFLKEMVYIESLRNLPWMGIKKTGGQWTTVEGSSSFIGWAPREPYRRGGCVAIHKDGLYDLPCGDKLPSICEQRRP